MRKIRIVKRWVFPLDEMNKHLWAFYYFCQRRGAEVEVDRGAKTVTIVVKD